MEFAPILAEKKQRNSFDAVLAHSSKLMMAFEQWRMEDCLKQHRMLR